MISLSFPKTENVVWNEFPLYAFLDDKKVPIDYRFLDIVKRKKIITWNSFYTHFLLLQRGITSNNIFDLRIYLSMLDVISQDIRNEDKLFWEQEGNFSFQNIFNLKFSGKHLKQVFSKAEKDDKLISFCYEISNKAVPLLCHSSFNDQKLVWEPVSQKNKRFYLFPEKFMSIPEEKRKKKNYRSIDIVSCQISVLNYYLSILRHPSINGIYKEVSEEFKIDINKTKVLISKFINGGQIKEDIYLFVKNKINILLLEDVANKSFNARGYIKTVHGVRKRKKENFISFLCQGNESGIILNLLNSLYSTKTNIHLVAGDQIIFKETSETDNIIKKTIDEQKIKVEIKYG